MDLSNLLTITFNEKIRFREIHLLRGAVIHSMNEESVLFHNHVGDTGFRYAYPLIQYKTINGHAAIVCLSDGTEAIGDFFTATPKEVHLGDKPVSLNIENINAQKIDIAFTDHLIPYKLKRWMPFNQSNYQKYKSLESITDKVEFLQHLLTGNILSFLKGINIHIDDKIELKILKIQPLRNIFFKGVRVVAYETFFKSNILLPNYIGLGKGVSLGFGTLYRVKTKEFSPPE